MKLFLRYLGGLTGSSVLDVGGTVQFWSGVDPSLVKVTLLNCDPALDLQKTPPVGEVVFGDGCAIPVADQTFDVTFSNSAIEHVGTWERQQRFALEASRTGRRIWVQTPARSFPIEPHLLTPFIHWLPKRWQRVLIPWASLRGWAERWGPREADAFLREVRLLTFAEMETLFPHCTIHRERFLWMTKSFVAVSTSPTHEPPRAH